MTIPWLMRLCSGRQIILKSHEALHSKRFYTTQYFVQKREVCCGLRKKTFYTYMEDVKS
jgi:hypothetical protein